jgi:hypothetical protein
MVSDLDIWRAANLLIGKHGADAELEAAKRADLMLDRGDDDGRLLWMRIRRAIEDLQALRRGRFKLGWRRKNGMPISRLFHRPCARAINLMLEAQR